MPAEGTVDVAREGRVAVVTLDRPPVNALSPSLMAQLQKAMKDLEGDEGVRAIVLTGSGKVFCGGGDIAAFAAMDDAELLDAIRAGQRLVWEVEHLEVPTIAAVNGPCLGGGNGVAMACDLRIASEDATFGHPEASLGLTLAYAGSARLARLVGPARAKELMFTARRVSAREALAIGLANEVVPAKELRGRALAVGNEIARNSPVAVRAAKRALLESLDEDCPDPRETEVRHLAQVLRADELREGFRAYLEKRPPAWRS